MMMKATIDVYFEASNVDEACDVLSETMRENLTRYNAASPIYEWRYSPSGACLPVECSKAEADSCDC